MGKDKLSLWVLVTARCDGLIYANLIRSCRDFYKIICFIWPFYYSVFQKNFLLFVQLLCISFVWTKSEYCWDCMMISLLNFHLWSHVIQDTTHKTAIYDFRRNYSNCMMMETNLWKDRRIQRDFNSVYPSSFLKWEVLYQPKSRCWRKSFLTQTLKFHSDQLQSTFSSVYVENGNLLDLQVICSIYILKCLFLLFNSLLQYQVLKNTSTIAHCFLKLKNQWWRVEKSILGGIFLHLPVSFSLWICFLWLPSKLTVTKMYSVYHLWQEAQNKTKFLN